MTTARLGLNAVDRGHVNMNSHRSHRKKRVEIGGSSGRCPAILMCAREFKALKLGEMDSCPVKEQLDTHCNGHAAPHALLGSLR